MKIVLAGSLGNISKPLAIQLIEAGHEVTVISSNASKQNEIQALGANPAIGSLEDIEFLSSTFRGSDAVYSMIPPNNYFDHSLDLPAYYKRLGDHYAAAISNSNVKRLVHLSSIGAHMEKGNGILSGTFVVEAILGELSSVNVTFMRPTSFFYNLAGYIPGIKATGTISTNYGTRTLIPWVSPLDIADAVAEELTSPTGAKVRYVASEELNGEDTAAILGAAIGKPGLRWNLISDEQTLQYLVGVGMNPNIAAGLVEMYAGLQSGVLSAHYQANRPAQMGRVKLADYAKEFAVAYNS